MELEPGFTIMEESWVDSRGVRSEEVDAELLSLLRLNFFCTPRPGHTHAHSEAYRKDGYTLTETALPLKVMAEHLLLHPTVWRYKKA